MPSRSAPLPNLGFREWPDAPLGSFPASSQPTATHPASNPYRTSYVGLRKPAKTRSLCGGDRLLSAQVSGQSWYGILQHVQGLSREVQIRLLAAFGHVRKLIDGVPGVPSYVSRVSPGCTRLPPPPPEDGHAGPPGRLPVTPRRKCSSNNPIRRATTAINRTIRAQRSPRTAFHPAQRRPGLAASYNRIT